MAISQENARQNQPSPQSWPQFIKTWAKLPPPLDDWTDAVTEHGCEYGVALFSKLAQDPKSVANDPTLTKLKGTVRWMVLAPFDDAVKANRRWRGAAPVRMALEEELNCVLEDRRAKELGGQQDGQQHPHQKRGVRTPDIETSRRRVALYDQLSSELAKVQQWRKGNRKSRDVAALKRDHPNFALWERLTERQQADLLTDEFRPTAYTWSIVRAVFGLSGESTSREVLKKDRRKIRVAELVQ